MAGGSPELDPPAVPAAPTRVAERPQASHSQLEVAFVAVACGAATVFFGIVPGPLFDLVHHTGTALQSLF
jgi:hypothetical protein